MNSRTGLYRYDERCSIFIKYVENIDICEKICYNMIYKKENKTQNYIIREDNTMKINKTTKCLIFNKDFYDEFEAFCDEYNFYKSDFIDKVITNDQRLINSIKIEQMIRRKGEKKRTTMTINPREYAKITPPISPRIEEALKIIMEQYREGNPRYEVIS